ncbi:hypothetical protein V5P93_000226 [Actinokineospora auranticolor]|uniref:Uncharacterized protein n=1 Tax=Actinokineospora auranticolor TaxID=155976 RepID=A0A2S6GL25_9PSEU|nr:hypothetical protein [Actinokineospora auranticolor]PPK65883.1 hypothetical protein CLV40_112146 [Actinokineospora auranticolor]
MTTTEFSENFDVGDVANPDAPDPTPEEITDPTHPDHVEPFTAATPVPEGV